MRLKTVNATIRLFRNLDPETAMNRTMLLRLIREKKIPCEMHGNRMLCDYDALLERLNEMLGMDPENGFLRLRSINGAFIELKKEKSELGIGKDRVRFLISEGRIPTLKAGNRNYLAMEMFLPPYDRQFGPESGTGCVPVPKRTFADLQLDQVVRRSNPNIVMCRA